jgi:hypothetical protein
MSVCRIICAAWQIASVADGDSVYVILLRGDGVGGGWESTSVFQALKAIESRHCQDLVEEFASGWKPVITKLALRKVGGKEFAEGSTE